MSRRIALALALSSLVACATTAGSAGETTASSTTVARGRAYSYTYEVRFGNDPEVAGYFVQFHAVPLGIADERDYPAGTMLVEDVDFELVGVIAPSLQAWTFDEEGRTVALPPGGRDDHVRRLLGRQGRPRYRSIHLGLPAAAP